MPVAAQPDGELPSHGSAPISLAVVVLTMNLPDDTIDCVYSLLADGFAANEIIVVDNGSATGRAALAHGLPSGVGQIFLPTNWGFAGGNNVGISAAADMDAEWVLVLNNDTLVQQGCRSALLEVMRTGAYDILSPLIFYSEEPKRIWALGDRRIMGTMLTHSLLRNQEAPASLPVAIPVDFVTGCALLVRMEVMRRIGTLDEGYFPIYAEDADFCLRAKRAGYQAACATRARILHKVSRTTGPTFSRTWQIENQARFYRRYAGRAQLLLLLGPFTLARTLLVAARAMAAGNSRVAEAALRGWRIGWFSAKHV